MITLGALRLPDGLVWADEFDWSPVAQATDYSLSGALLLQESIKQSGRPITLKGQQDGNHYTAGVMRGQSFLGWSSLDALRAALMVANTTLTLTLHDGRTFRVTPRQEGDGPLKVEPRPVFKSFAPATPGADTRYFVAEIRLIEVPL